MEQSTSNEIRMNTTMTSNPSRTVRTNVISTSWSHISNASKILLLISLGIIIIQFTVSVVMLILGRNEICEKPLQSYLIIYTVRVALSFPLIIYQHLFKQRNPTVNENTDIHSMRHQHMTANTNTQGDPTVIDGWADRFKSLLDLFAILWFIIGNYLIFSNSSCSESSPFYYYTILAWILLGYLLLIVPLLLCLSVVFCLPLVLVALRAFNINISNVMVGGTKEELMTIPIYRFKSSHHTTSDEDSKSMQHKKNIFQRLISHKRKNRNSNDSCQNEYKMISIEREEDAVCSICLSEYENNDLICKLWCEHCYHKDCIHEWLALNTKCPLCKRDFRHKEEE